MPGPIHLPWALIRVTFAFSASKASTEGEPDLQHARTVRQANILKLLERHQRHSARRVKQASIFRQLETMPRLIASIAHRVPILESIQQHRWQTAGAVQLEKHHKKAVLR